MASTAAVGKLSPSLPHLPTQSHHHRPSLLSYTPKPSSTSAARASRCFASSNGCTPGSGRGDDAEQAEQRAQLAACIASGEFNVQQSRLVPLLRSGLSKLGAPGEVLSELLSLSRWAGSSGSREEESPVIPLAMGSIVAARGKAFFILLYCLFLNYGGIFRLMFGPKSFLVVSDPAIAKHILRENSKAYSKGILAEILEFVMGKGLLPADGEIWHVRRRAIVPALHQKYVATMTGLFGQASYRLCEKLEAVAADGEDVEMESLFSRLTLDIIGKAVFNYEFDSLTHDNGIAEAIYTVLREAGKRSTSFVRTWEIPIWKDISPRQKKVNEALELINGSLDDLIAICKVAFFVRNIVDARFERMIKQEELQFHEEYVNEQDPSILHFLLASGDDVSSKQLRDDLMTLLIAGHETTAAVLTWTFYLLSKEPRVMAKLQDEVDSVLGDGFPTIEDMKKLKYTTRVINESLRLYPQPPVLVRRSLEDDVLGKYPIKRGEDIFISVWNLHHCPKHWVDAESFNPERWPLDGPNPDEINQNFSYLPFGGGPRKCVGDMFASFETVVATAMLVRRFNFQMAVTAPPVEMTTGGTIHTTEGLVMTVTRRTRPPIISSLETKKAPTVDDQPQSLSPSMAGTAGSPTKI